MIPLGTAFFEEALVESSPHQLLPRNTGSPQAFGRTRRYSSSLSAWQQVVILGNSRLCPSHTWNHFELQDFIGLQASPQHSVQHLSAMAFLGTAFVPQVVGAVP